MYESPINVIINDMCRDVRQKEDNYIMEYIQNIGIDVDEDELAKALRYDRQQYDKGYEDGFDAGMRNILNEIVKSSKSLECILEKYKDLIEEDK